MAFVNKLFCVSFYILIINYMMSYKTPSMASSPFLSDFCFGYLAKNAGFAKRNTPEKIV